MVVLPADHVIPKTRISAQILTLAAQRARDGYLVTLGIPPTSPDTGFGYIQSGPVVPKRRPDSLPSSAVQGKA